MLVLDTKQISKRGGLYNLHADQNLAELKSIMKDLIVKERPSSHTPAVWASDRTEYAKKNASAQTDMTIEPKDPKKYTFPAPNEATGGRVWAYGPRKKKTPTVKTFAL